MESPGRSVNAPVAYFDQHLVALNEVEPFFLCIVQMAHRPALRNIAMLYQKETGLGVFGKDLEIEVRACARPMMLCPSRVRARGDKHRLSERACNFSDDLNGWANGSATATFRKLRRSTLRMAEMLLLARVTGTTRTTAGQVESIANDTQAENCTNTAAH
jgi:hypothetical protein